MGAQYKLHSLFIVAFTVITWTESTPSTTTARPVCDFGPSLAQKFNELSYRANERITLNCSHSCSRLDCSGILNLQKVPVSEVFCFGLSLNHCDNPASLGFYLNVPNKNVFKYGKLTHGETDSIPGPSTPLGNISFVLGSKLVHVNETYIQYGLDLYVKVTLSLINVFPYQFALLPPQYIRVPPCALHSTDAPMPTVASKCVAPMEPVTKPQTTPQAPVIIKSKTYNTSCEFGLFECGKYEMCTAVPTSSKYRKNGVCRCQLKAKLSPETGMCETNSVTTAPTSQKTSMTTGALPTPASKTSSNTEKKSGPSTTVIIVASVVGGVILSAIVVGLIIYVGRRRRNNRYRDRLQLLSDDDDDNPNVVI